MYVPCFFSSIQILHSRKWFLGVNYKYYRKFGKQIQKQQLEVPGYATSFVNYKALKKLIKKLSATPLPSVPEATQDDTENCQTALSASKATFFFKLEREIEKVNAIYLQKEAELQIRLKALLEKKTLLKSKNQLTSRRFAKFTTLEEGFQQFVNDLNRLQQLVEINGTAFSKILKKWDKTSKSKTRELYLLRAVEVQPFYNPTVLSELSDQATTSLQELSAWSEGDLLGVGEGFDHISSSQHLLGTDEGDAETLLLETVISGNVEFLEDLLLRLKISTQQKDSGNNILQERITRTFLAATNGGPPKSLQLLLDTGLVDFKAEDEINERNCLHQATIYGNLFVFKESLKGNVEVNRADVYGQIPLHYASIHGRLDMVEALLDGVSLNSLLRPGITLISSADPSTINLIDHSHFTPLIHAIRGENFECVKLLLGRSARIEPISDSDHIPLNLACEIGSVKIVELLLEHGAKLLPNSQGLYPQHLVSRSGKTSQLLLILKKYGAHLDQTDKLYSWTPLFHAASEGNVSCMRTLLDNGVQVDTLDKKRHSAMYYAAWEGHFECMQLLSLRSTPNKITQSIKKSDLPFFSSGSSNIKKKIVEIDTIPELELPPPIIPFRRYGHNFLDNKTLIQISFGDDGHEPLTFFRDYKYPASRLTIYSKFSELIPKNVLLPVQEDTKLVSFKVDNLDNFTIDIDVFSAYGAKVIGRTVALPHTFRNLTRNSGHCCLALFDPRLRVIGQISFNFEVVKPFQGNPLGIADFETYWKSTSLMIQKPNAFVTNSSLSGVYVQLFVQLTCDGIPVLWPRWTINYMDIELPISQLTYAQFLTAGSGRAKKFEDLVELQNQPLKSIAEIHRIFSNSTISLKDAFEILPVGMHVNLQILYPTETEKKELHFGPINNIDVLCDETLSIVFDHARRTRKGSTNGIRLIVFSSSNPTVCTALNWKQPNYPVFLNNDLGHHSTISGHLVASMEIIQTSGRRSISVKEAVRIAKENNLMGLCCSSILLEMVPALVDAIKAQGLLLVMDKFAISEADVTHNISNLIPNLPQGIDGVLTKNGVLRFI
ncbi:hypothetical protein Golomagni_01327 [Golovinomyces magnicellulatus]|nr:hypothetical protein Golomagni_01327 [Golovinomyces magnicellulatus]